MTSTRHSTARLPHKRMLPAMLALVLAGTAVPVSPLSAAPARTAAATALAVDALAPAAAQAAYAQVLGGRNDPRLGQMVSLAAE